MNSLVLSVYFVCFCQLGDGSSSGYTESSEISWQAAIKTQREYCGELLWETPGTNFESREQAREAGHQAARCEVITH